MNRNRTRVALTFEPSSASGLHLAGTAGCTACCTQPPPQPWFAAFSAMAPNGSWVAVHTESLTRNTVVLSSSVAMSGVRHNWGGYPDCSLYNGAGGPDNRSAIAAPPFRRCFFGTFAALPGWSWLSECNPSPDTTWMQPSAPQHEAALPTSAPTDFILMGATLARGQLSDVATSGMFAISTGAPKAGASITVRYPLLCPSGLVVDSVSLSIRYAPLALPSGNFTPATLQVLLANADNRPVVTVATAVELGAKGRGTAYVAPVRVDATGLKAACDAGVGAEPRGQLLLQLVVTNNDRPVAIPIDDRAGGFNVSVGWASSSP
eukprot:7384930-Prymnesium_polylepis.1